MSEAARRERAVKRSWAHPGSRHDVLVTAAKIGLPSAVGVLIAFLAMAPLQKDGDVSFILDKNEVDTAPERMRVESARYEGHDNHGQPFTIVAREAVQRSSDVPIVDIRGMLARLGLTQGPAAIEALSGRYDLGTQQVAVDGPVRVSAPDGYRLQTRDVNIDLKRQMVTSTGPASGEMRLGTFSAGSLRADVRERRVSLGDGVRLKIVQGAVR